MFFQRMETTARPPLGVFFGIAFRNGFLDVFLRSQRPPDRLTVHPSPHRKVGVVHVYTCVSGGGANDVSVDDGGIAKTSRCPSAGHTVELEIVEEDNRHYLIPADEVQVRRTGDGIATGVEAPLHHNWRAPPIVVTKSLETVSGWTVDLPMRYRADARCILSGAN
jgi:hypothetical protein